MCVSARYLVIGACWHLFQVGDQFSGIDGLGPVADLAISDLDDPPPAIAAQSQVNGHER